MTAPGGRTPEELSVLAHDLQTPITVVIGYAELLEKRSGEAETRDTARRIGQAGKRLRTLVQRLVDGEL